MSEPKASSWQSLFDAQLILFPSFSEAPPTAGDDIEVTLSGYSLLYVIQQIRIPTSRDYDGVTDLTEEYLDEYFESVFSMQDAVIYRGSTTVRTDTDFSLGQPTQVDYSTVVTVSDASSFVPEASDLDALLRAAFSAPDVTNYLDLVSDLPLTNIFTTTTEVTFQEGATPASASFFSPGVAAAAGAGFCVLLLAGYMILRKTDDEDDVNLHKFVDTDGHQTVAGETVGSSLDSQSAIHRMTSDTESEHGDYQLPMTRRKSKRPRQSPPSSPRGAGSLGETGQLHDIAL